METDERRQWSKRIMITLTRRNTLFGVFSFALLICCFGLLRQLVTVALNTDYGSHIILIPFISMTLIYLNRTRIFQAAGYSLRAGAVVMCIGVAVTIVASTANARLSENDYLSLMSVSTVTLWLGGFLLFYGVSTFRAALFPLLFLYFMVPLPSVFLNPFIVFLQKGSTEVVNLLFKLTGTPFHRAEFVFALPGLTIHVAEQCSGIRSSIALLLTSLLAGYLFLKSGYNRMILALVVFPISIFKNALRITTLSLLAIHVDDRILTSSLHSEGGIPFFVLALVFLLPVLALLRKIELGGLEPRAKEQRLSKTLGPRANTVD
jgi:exosortase